MSKNITAAEIRDYFNYDPLTGEIRRRRAGLGRRNADGTCGTVGRKGYRSIRYKGGQIKAHRLAWLYVYGCWPADLIDHINGDRLDNRISNLRLANNSLNMANRKTNANSSTGLKGVSFRRGTWIARIQHCGKRYHIGRFLSPEEAKAAYDAEAAKLFGEFARAA